MTAQALIRKSSRWLTDWLPSILLVMLLLITRSTLADHYHVPSGSMENTLIPGDHVVVNKMAYGLRVPFTHHVLAFQEDPQPGEIVIFNSPEEDIRLIKRVVAVEGDHVELRQGRLIVNGERLTSNRPPYIETFGDRSAELNLTSGGGPDITGIVVPEGHVLVLNS